MHVDTQLEALQRAAHALGGQAALASALGFADRRNVWPWFQGRRVPAEHCPAIERATREAAKGRGDPSMVVSCEELRPDVAWGVLREQAAASHARARALDAVPTHPGHG